MDSTADAEDAGEEEGPAFLRGKNCQPAGQGCTWPEASEVALSGGPSHSRLLAWHLGTMISFGLKDLDSDSNPGMAKELHVQRWLSETKSSRLPKGLERGGEAWFGSVFSRRKEMSFGLLTIPSPFFYFMASYMEVILTSIP